MIQEEGDHKEKSVFKPLRIEEIDSRKSLVKIDIPPEYKGHEVQYVRDYIGITVSDNYKTVQERLSYITLILTATNYLKNRELFTKNLNLKEMLFFYYVVSDPESILQKKDDAFFKFIASEIGVQRKHCVTAWHKIKSNVRDVEEFKGMDKDEVEKRFGQALSQRTREMQ